MDISVALGARSMGSHFGILSVTDLQNSKRKNFLTQEAIHGWHEIAEYAARRGLEYLTWEPMSIPREFGETIRRAETLHRRLNTKAPLPIRLCLDVDHGDVSSHDPQDTDPYAWIAALGSKSPILHIKQSLREKSGHYPFIDAYNRQGKIVPQKIISAIRQFGHADTVLFLELAFREREPFESQILPHLKESVEYWRSHVEV